MYKKPKKELKETITWECPNGHWSRVEYLFADGIVEEALCPLCKQKMHLGKRMLANMRNVVYNDYTHGFNNSYRAGKGD